MNTNSNKVQLANEIKQTLSQTKTRLIRFLPLNIAEEVPQQPTASTDAGRNSQLTTVTDVIRRPQPNRRPYCGESRLSTSSILDQSQNSRQRNSRFQSEDPNSNMAHCSFPSTAAILLPSFTGGPITRFDSWLESFESIVDGSGWSEEKIIQMLCAKLTDRAFYVIQAILKEHPQDYKSRKEALLDHFYGDKNFKS
ncbi:hypothetical protein OUZ56_021708 [Daphnia magna]|uniref:Uncharacterized protein n=1 Tax=Daphnia magna TaxID=35525 RepID=A0ABR0AU91_9CRUS|nr:hypothetical protein OUZ56_021708 [Daphnia magna]